MLSFLNSKSKRLYNIVEEMSKKSEKVTVEEIRTMNSCSLKTVYEDLNYLEEKYDYLFDYNFSKNSITEIKILESQLVEFRRVLLNQTIHVKILNLLLTEKRLSLYELCYRLNYSDTTVRRALTKLNAFVSCYGLEIVKDSNNDYRISGNKLSLLVIVEKYIDQEALRSLSDKEMEVFNTIILKINSHFHEYLHTFIKQNIWRLYVVERTLNFKVLKRTLEEKFSKKDLVQIEKEHLEMTLNKSLQKEKIFFSKQQIYFLVDVLYIYRLYSQELVKNVCGDYSVTSVFYDKVKVKNEEHVKKFEKILLNLSKQLSIPLLEYRCNIFHLIYPYLTWGDEVNKVQIGLCPEKNCIHGELYKQIIESEFKNCEVHYYDENRNYDFLISNDILFSKEGFQIIYVNDYLSEDNLVAIYEAIVQNRRKVYCLPQ